MTQTHSLAAIGGGNLRYLPQVNIFNYGCSIDLEIQRRKTFEEYVGINPMTSPLTWQGLSKTSQANTQGVASTKHWSHQGGSMIQFPITRNRFSIRVARLQSTIFWPKPRQLVDHHD